MTSLTVTLLAVSAAGLAQHEPDLQEIARKKVSEVGLDIIVVDPDERRQLSKETDTPRKLLFASSPPPECPGEDAESLFARRVDAVMNELFVATTAYGYDATPFPGPPVPYSYFLDLERLYTEDVVIDVLGGWTTQRSHEGFVQYEMVVGASFNMNWLNYSLRVAAADPAAATFSADGDVFTLGLGFPAKLVGDGISFTRIASQQRLTFEPCSLRIAKEVRGPPPLEVNDHAIWLANYSRAQGTYDLCVYHEAYCTGELRQYDSFDSCIAYVSALPAVSEVCGEKYPMAGNSKACRFSQKFSIPYQPQVQCPLIGPAESNAPGRVECTDHVHCPLMEGTEPALWSQTTPPPEFFDALLAYERFFNETYDMEPVESGNFSSYKFFTGAPKPWEGK